MSEAAAGEVGDRDYSASLLGVLCFLAILPHRGFKQFGASEGIEASCAFVLGAIVSKVIPEGLSWGLSVNWEGTEIQLTGTGTSLSIQGQSSRITATLFRLIPRSGPVHSFLIALAAIVQRPSKYRSCVGLAKHLFVLLAMALQHEVEASRGDEVYSTGDGLSLEPSRKTGSRKCRRVPLRFKQSVLAAIWKGSYLRSAQQLLAAKGILSKSHGGARPMSPKGGASFLRQERMSYLYTCRKVLRDVRWFHSSCDATSVGGRKWLQLAGYSVERALGVWCVPQEPLPQRNLLASRNARSIASLP